MFLFVLRHHLGSMPSRHAARRPRSGGGRTESPTLKDSVGVPGWLTGGIERLVLTILVGFDAGRSTTASMTTAMLAWLGLKLASNWNRPEQTESSTACTRSRHCSPASCR